MRKISTFYIKQSQIIEDKIEIIGDDVNHIKNVLRYKLNDELEVCDDLGARYYTKISEFLPDKILLEVIGKSEKNTELPVKIDLFQGLPKSDKMDLIVQKTTELGISSVIPVITDRVVVKIEKGNERKKVERWNKIALEAAKQSGRQVIPTVENVMNLEKIIEKLSKYDIVIVPFECEKDSTLKNILKNVRNKVENIAVVIGPEGGFSDRDIEILEKCPNVEKISLGKRILRTETAGLATLAMLLYEYEL